MEEKESWKENKRSVSFNSKLFQKRHNAKIFNSDRAGSLWTVPGSRTINGLTVCIVTQSKIKIVTIQ